MNKSSQKESIKKYIPKLMSNLERGFWLDAYLRESMESNPDKDPEELINELFKSQKAMRWLTEDDVNKAIKWARYCKANNH